MHFSFSLTAWACAQALLMGPIPTARPEAAVEVPLRSTHDAGDVTVNESVLLIELEQRSGTFVVGQENGLEHDARRNMLLVQRAHWTDRVITAEAGRPTEFIREFGDVVGGFGIEDIGEALKTPEDNHALDDKRIHFKWSEDDTKHERKFFPPPSREDEPDPSLLEGLAAVIDGAGWLPEARDATTTEVGDRWKADAPTIGAALLPLGRVRFGSADPHSNVYGAYTGFTSPVPPPSPLEWWGPPGFTSIDGDVEVHLEAVLQEGGEAVAELVVKVDVRSERNATSWLEASDLDDYLDTSAGHLTIATRLEGKGTLCWNVDRGLATEWTFDGELELELTGRWTLGRTQPRYDCDAHQLWTGSLRSRHSAAREE